MASEFLSQEGVRVTLSARVSLLISTQLARGKVGVEDRKSVV